MRRWEVDWRFAGGMFVITLFASWMAWLMYYEWKYPCVRTEQYQSTCGGDTYCVTYDSNWNCMMWTTNATYPCTRERCVERTVRE